MFSAPQYNTWIEMPYRPTQHAVLSVRPTGSGRAGFPAGVLMIDDQWSIDYGNWAFDARPLPGPGGDVPTSCTTSGSR